ncbi:hypothetical protein [Chryseolinea sp. H1M3-3]|uniref:hypothetical protein n=1 Tax=Chryseolinea sp. H1M3-3 TaxID=3034144 RepID=UPI0023EB925B|nr:hypothetical protein [Chryseolinea sp. H1M3-3]
MTTINKIKQELLAWSVVLAVFAVLTLLAVNFDNIRNSRWFNSSGTKESAEMHHDNVELHQPGNSTVLAQ